MPHTNIDLNTLNWLRRHAHESPPAPATTPLSRAVRAACVASLLLVAATGYAQSLPLFDSFTLTFTAATREYARMHRRIEQQLGPIQVTDRPETIQRAIAAMAAAIRAERPDAKQGDFFTPVIARELRVRVDRALREHGFTAADVQAAGRAEGVDPAAFTLQVNGTFPWVLGAAMFACVTKALPELPPELQYRIVGNDLVLIDVHAGLIVDLLPRALADPGTTIR